VPGAGRTPAETRHGARAAQPYKHRSHKATPEDAKAYGGPASIIVEPYIGDRLSIALYKDDLGKHIPQSFGRTARALSSPRLLTAKVKFATATIGFFGVPPVASKGFSKVWRRRPGWR